MSCPVVCPACGRRVPALGQREGPPRLLRHRLVPVNRKKGGPGNPVCPQSGLPAALPWTNQADYMESWVWPSERRGWYCRVTHEWYATREEAEAAVRRADRATGIVWPWQLLVLGKS